MHRILVLAPPEDHAQRAVTLASELAARNGARLVLLRVLEETIRPSAADDGGAGASRLREILIEAEQRAMEALAGPLRACGLDVRTEVCWGVAWDAILDRVDRDGIDLVVKPAHGVTHEGRVFFGSTALHLFRKCPCPVWVVGDEGRLPRSVLAAIDPATHASRLAVARRILGWADRVAQWSEATLEVASAWHAPGAAALKDRIEPTELDDYVRDAHDRARRAQAEIVTSSPSPVPDERAHLIQGSPRDVLPRYVEERDFDLVVMGTLGRSGIAGELLGETAEMILRAVHCSVLTVSPRSPDPGRA